MKWDTIYTMLPLGGLELRQRLDAIFSPLPTGGRGFFVRASASNGLISRLQAARRHYEQLFQSVDNYDAPPFDERDLQEADLYEFVSSGVSAVGCGFLFAFALGYGMAPDLPIERYVDLYPRGIVKYFKVWFPSHPVTLRMDQILHSMEFNRFQELRNQLDHRGTIPRTFRQEIGRANQLPPTLGKPEAEPPAGLPATEMSRESFDPLREWLEMALESLVSALESGLSQPPADATSAHKRTATIAIGNVRGAFDKAMEVAKVAVALPESKAELGKFVGRLNKLLK